MENAFGEFIKNYESDVVDLFRKTHLAFFNASISGKESDYKAASDLEIEIAKYFSNTAKFDELKYLLNNCENADPLIKRQLLLIYNEYAANQFDQNLQKKIIKLSSKVEEQFSTFRAKLNGSELTDNEIDNILKKVRDSKKLEETWKASKQISKVVEKDVIALIRMRNESAKLLGYKNFHQMSLELSEQDSEQLEKLFDDLDKLTEDKFTILKIEIDDYLATFYEIPKSELMPWHYQDKFFQQGPKIYSTNLDDYFKEQNLVEITRKYFQGIGLSIDDLLEKSDLFEKEGKYQHAYCTNIDKSGDVRVVCNVKADHKWMGTLLHEYGHAVYDKFVDQNLPWKLRTHNHIFVTEAIAMLFGRFSSHHKWLKDVLQISDIESDKISKDCFNSLRVEQLVFTRWVQVIFRFEKAMYENPDQDLNSLWWNLVEKYQQIKKPAKRDEPDWASKIHIALYPVYYHNYMLGELLASQISYYISKNVLNSSEKISFNNQEFVGKYLRTKIFEQGAKNHWAELIKFATGEELTPRYYAEQFVTRP